MKITQVDIDRFMGVLGRTPRLLAEMTAGRKEEELHARPDKTTWSVNDVLAHLRSCADVWGKSIADMLSRENPTLPDVHPRERLRQTDYRVLDFRRSLAVFSEQRRELMGQLTGLAFDEWSRGAVISGRRHTVFSQVRRMARHEIEHLEQIRNLLK